MVSFINFNVTFYHCSKKNCSYMFCKKKKKSTYLYLRLFQAQVRQLVGQVFAIKGSSRVFLVVVTMTLLMAL